MYLIKTIIYNLRFFFSQWNGESNQFYLHSIMSEHKKTISAIAWHLKDNDILASSSIDFKICVWHVTKHKLLATLNTPHSVPSLMAWFPTEDDCIAYCDGKGPLYLWKYSQSERDGTSHPLKEISAVSSNICQFSWHATTTGRFALGHADGTVSFYIQGKLKILFLKMSLLSRNSKYNNCLLKHRLKKLR